MPPRLIEEKLDLPWSCAGRVDMVDADLLTLMKKAGCWQIWYGVESGSDAVLKTLCKHTTTTVGYDHNLSKRTDVYGVVMNDRFTGLKSGTSLAVGIRHRF